MAYTTILDFPSPALSIISASSSQPESSYFYMCRNDSAKGGLAALDIQSALALVRDDEEGETDDSVLRFLEEQINHVWTKMQTEPHSYILNRDEFALFNYYRSRFGDSAIAQNAVARFWNNYHGS